MRVCVYSWMAKARLREQAEDSVTGLQGSLQTEAGLRFFFKGGRVRNQREGRRGYRADLGKKEDEGAGSLTLGWETEAKSRVDFLWY